MLEDVPDPGKKKKADRGNDQLIFRNLGCVRSVFHWSVYHHVIFRKHGLHGADQKLVFLQDTETGFWVNDLYQNCCGFSGFG